MKIIGIFVVAALVLFSACGSEYSSETVIHAVDIWMPLVQVMPPQGIWDVQASETEGTSLVTDVQLAISASREGRIYYETQRIYAFFGTVWGLFDRDADFRFPEFFGGRYWYRVDREPVYLYVYVVEGFEDEAAGFLEYIADFETVMLDTTNVSYNDLMDVFHQVWEFRWTPNPLSAVRVNVRDSKVILWHVNYSDEEKKFIRVNVSDSHLIEFRCGTENER